MSRIIDLRSDTVTKPSKKMKEFMLTCEVGDDVYGEDPTVKLFESSMATMAGKEEALFVPSGTQSNLLALLSHCQRGDEYICGQEAHLYRFEAGGASVLGGIQAQPLDFESDATLSLKKIKKNIKPDDNHFARTKLICLENTHDGKVLPLTYLKKLKKFAKKNELLLHLDGARVFNAATFLGIEVKQICKYFDSISICLSKGLGAPVGSVLLGKRDFIEKARRYRKMLGGGMRQSGILAAAGLYAINHNIEDLNKDHLKTQLLCKALEKIKQIKIVSIDTNMLFIKVNKKIESSFVNYLKSKGVLISGYSKLRLVLHRDIKKEDIEKVVIKINDFFAQ